MFEILIFYNEGRENYRINFISSTNYAISQFFLSCLSLSNNQVAHSSLIKFVTMIP